MKAKLVIGKVSLEESGKPGFVLLELWEEGEAVEITERTFEEYLREIIKKEL